MKSQHVVLVVEDEPSVADVMCTWLELGQFRVHVAHDGVEGLAAAERIEPCVLVLDLHLPLLNGGTLARRLRARGNQVPIVVVSSDPQARATADEIGAVAFIPKAFGLPRLLSVVDEICSGRAQSPSAPAQAA